MHDSGLVVLGINKDDKPSTVAKFQQVNGYSFPMLVEAKKVFKQYGVEGIPRVIIVSSTGAVLADFEGAQPYDTLLQAVSNALAHH